MAIDAARVTLDNGSQPDPPTLPEADVADMEYFLTQISVVLPVLNYHFLRPTRPVVGANPNTGVSRAIKLVLKPERAQQLLATAIYSDADFVVLKDSLARRDSPDSINVYRERRAALIASGRLRQRGPNQDYVFTEDTPFSSPSAAAAVILDRNANGRTEWRTEDLSKTLKEYQESSLSTDPEE